jgi:hypothetical protein
MRSQEAAMKKDIHNFTLDYFIKHQKTLVKKYNGKELLMDSSGVVATFDTLKEALAVGDETIGYGKFSVMKCLPGKEAYTATIGPLFSVK